MQGPTSRFLTFSSHGTYLFWDENHAGLVVQMGEVLKLNNLLKQELAWIFLEELRHMKIRGRHLHTLRQPPNLQTFRPLWTWKALFQAHQEVDPLAAGQRECVSHCEQSYGKFQCLPGCQASSPSNASKNTSVRKENTLLMALHHFVTGLCFFLRLRNISFCRSWWPQGDRHAFCKFAVSVTQINNFIMVVLLAWVSTLSWISSALTPGELLASSLQKHPHSPVASLFSFGSCCFRHFQLNWYCIPSPAAYFPMWLSSWWPSSKVTLLQSWCINVIKQLFRH